MDVSSTAPTACCRSRWSSARWRRPAPSPCGRPADMTRRLSLFGATGSVGRSTLDLVRRDGERWCVTVLTANSDVAELAKLAQEFRPEIAVIADAAHYAALKDALAGDRKSTRLNSSH